MDVEVLVRALAERRRLAHRDRWSREQVRVYRQARLAELRRWAVTRSTFYERHHAGLVDAPLSELPPVTKPMLMDAFDDVLTTRDMTLAAIEERLRRLSDSSGDPGARWRRRWRTAATAGTTGVRAVLVWNEREWATVLASYARATVWAGTPTGLRPVRMAVVSSRNPTHQSAVVAASAHSPLIRSLRLDATAPLSETVSALNAFAPEVLVGYSSALRPLALAQIEGSLHIRPRAVMSASEVLSESAARVMTTAWTRAPFDVYAATETAGIASTCEHGRRHLYDDLVIVEPVDAAGAPVPMGTTGARLLVTVLFSRTVPLIRYELSDRVAIGSGDCPCGRPYRLLETLEGRAEDALSAAGRTHAGDLTGLLRNVVEQFPVDMWQLAETAPDEIRVLVVPHGGDALVVDEMRRRLEARPELHGHRVRVDEVATLPRTPLGKAPLRRSPPGR